MAWPDLRIRSWGHFEAIANQAWPSPETKHYFFRGQADSSWRLKPTLARLVPPGSVTEDEIDDLQEQAMELFSAHVNAPKDGSSGLLSPPPEHGLDWAAVMQHHRAPTLLLDWSYSPFIAAYFAVAELDRWDKDGTVWFFHESLVDVSANNDMYARARFNNTPPDPSLRKYFAYSSTYPNTRMKAQYSLFTWCRSLDKTHDEIIDAILGGFKVAGRNAAGAMLGLPDMQEQYGQLIIPAALKPEILRELAVRKGISGETIYTGLDGVGQAVAESVKLRVAATAAPASAAAPVSAPVRP
jgi:FRG domain